jgi:hypothetical protein
VLAGAAVVAFPCPPSSGPKVKVLEAIAGARTVVTTEAGVEGLCPGAHPGAVITDADPEAFAAGLGRVLGDPLAGRQAALEARSAIIAVHSPRPAARTRLQVLA